MPVLFVIDLQTRRVQIGGVVRQAYGAWMKQVARNLTDGVDGLLIGKRYLLHDRDPMRAINTCRPMSFACLRAPHAAASPAARAATVRIAIVATLRGTDSSAALAPAVNSGNRKALPV